MFQIGLFVCLLFSIKFTQSSKEESAIYYYYYCYTLCKIIIAMYVHTQHIHKESERVRNEENEGFRTQCIIYLCEQRVPTS